MEVNYLVPMSEQEQTEIGGRDIESLAAKLETLLAGAVGLGDVSAKVKIHDLQIRKLVDKSSPTFFSR